MDKYFNEMIKLILNKEYKEAYELSEKMRGEFKTRCKTGGYTNIEMARRDWCRLYCYRETATSLYMRQVRRETQEFEKVCNDIVEIIRKGYSDVS